MTQKIWEIPGSPGQSSTKLDDCGFPARQLSRCFGPSDADATQVKRGMVALDKSWCARVCSCLCMFMYTVYFWIHIYYCNLLYMLFLRLFCMLISRRRGPNNWHARFCWSPGCASASLEDLLVMSNSSWMHPQKCLLGGGNCGNI